MNIELEYIKALVSLASEHKLSELKVSTGDKKIVIKKEKEIQLTTPTVTTAVTSSVDLQSSAEQAQTESTQAQIPTVTAKRGVAVASPIVGTFYSAPSPESPPFVAVGQKVIVGQVLCIIESMKLMNEIESEVAGTVLEICVKNAEPVEEGTILMYIE